MLLRNNFPIKRIDLESVDLNLVHVVSCNELSEWLDCRLLKLWYICPSVVRNVKLSNVPWIYSVPVSKAAFS